MVANYKRQTKQKYEKLQNQCSAGVLMNLNRNSQKAYSKLKESKERQIIKSAQPIKAKQIIASVSPNNNFAEIKVGPSHISEIIAQPPPVKIIHIDPPSVKTNDTLADRPLPTLNKGQPSNNLIGLSNAGEPQGHTELFECPEGCGRSFNKKAIEKHAKICKKVFQQKRRQFVASQQRQIEDAKEISHLAVKQIAASKNDSKEAKWKTKSLTFRANLKKTKGAPLTAEEQQVLKQLPPDLVQCQFCSRRFNKTAADKHIPICEKKSKKK